MSALNEPVKLRSVPGWHGPTTLPDLLHTLALTPTLGSTDAERAAAFLRLPQAAAMPARLRTRLEKVT